MQKRNRLYVGFSLIELLIAIAIMGILASIAYPSYNHYIVKTRRSDAHTALLDLANRMERYFISHNTYAGATLSNMGVNAVTQSGYYTLAINNLSDNTYTLTAIPRGVQTEDSSCGTLGLNQLGQKTSTGSLSATECW